METEMQGPCTITAFFDDRGNADNAVARLETAGLASSDIEIIAGRDPSKDHTDTASDDEGFMAKLKNMFSGPEDYGHDTYAEGLRRGGYVVSARTTASYQTRVIDILEQDG